SVTTGAANFSTGVAAAIRASPAAAAVAASGLVVPNLTARDAERTGVESVQASTLGQAAIAAIAALFCPARFEDVFLDRRIRAITSLSALSRVPEQVRVG